MLCMAPGKLFHEISAANKKLMISNGDINLVKGQAVPIDAFFMRNGAVDDWTACPAVICTCTKGHSPVRQPVAPWCQLPPAEPANATVLKRDEQ